MVDSLDGGVPKVALVTVGNTHVLGDRVRGDRGAGKDTEDRVLVTTNVGPAADLSAVDGRVGSGRGGSQDGQAQQTPLRDGGRLCETAEDGKRRNVRYQSVVHGRRSIVEVDGRRELRLVVDGLESRAVERWRVERGTVQRPLERGEKRLER